MKRFLGVLFLALGCAQDPVAKNTTDNPKVPVDLLFTNNGCSVYRFFDAGRYHYYADCTGAVTDIRIENKTTHFEEIPSVRR